MRFLWIAFLFCHASFSNDAACKKSLVLMSNLATEKIATLYDFKNNNHGNWVVAEKRFDVDFVLAPEEVQRYGLKWKVKQYGKVNPNFQDGARYCDIPLSWQLRPQKTLHIVYPQLAHGQKEDTVLHSLTSFAGIYLSKSLFRGFPDTVRIMWHLNQIPLSEQGKINIMASFPFIAAHNVSILSSTLDEQSEVQLVALHFSQFKDFFAGEQRWFITNQEDLNGIRMESFKTPESKHNTWLPWLDFSRPEFSARTLSELYQTTIVAPLGATSIYHRDTHSYDPNWGSVADIAQLYYDIVSPLVRGRMEGGKPLFAHLLLQTKVGYELFTFEIHADGTIEPLSNEPIVDPSYIGLPSAQELGFRTTTAGDTATIK